MGESAAQTKMTRAWQCHIWFGHVVTRSKIKIKIEKK